MAIFSSDDDKVRGIRVRYQEFGKNITPTITRAAVITSSSDIRDLVLV